jgi:hypothetical protein
LTAQDIQRLDGLTSTDAVRIQPTVPLKVRQRTDCCRPQNTVWPTAVKSNMVECVLQFFDVITPELGRTKHKKTVAKFPTCFDERQPRLLIADTADVQATHFLELLKGFLSGRAKRSSLSTNWAMPGSTEAAL